MDGHDEEDARNFFLVDTTSPKDVGRASFPLVRRGFDPIEVQGFARAVSAELTRLQQEISDLRTALSDAERRADVGIDEDIVLEFLGEESVRLLSDARATAQQVRGRAEETAARSVAEAESESHTIRAEAQTYAADMRAAGEQRAKELTADAERNARSLVTSAKKESGQMIREAEDQAAGLVADAELRAETLVAAAETQREQVLGDLATRRDALSAQVDRLLASRRSLSELVARVRVQAEKSLDELEYFAGSEYSADAAGRADLAIDEAPTTATLAS